MESTKASGFFLVINYFGEEITTGIIPEGELVEVLRVLTQPSMFGNFDICVHYGIPQSEA